MNSLKIKSNNNFNLEDNEYNCNPSKSVNLLKFDLKNNGENINDIEFNKRDKLVDDEQIIPERNLLKYVNNPFLSDAILKLDNNKFYFHKIILCASSDYINLVISEPVGNNGKDKKEDENKTENKKENENLIINFPEIISSSFGGGNRKNCIEKILNYCYNNQDFKYIDSDINQYNIFTFLELSHSLGIKSLKLHLERKIINNYIGRDNVSKLAIESKMFDLQKLNKECIKFIINNFKYLKEFKNDIIDLDFDTFKQIINSNEINIESERDISNLVINYISLRREIKEIKEGINNEQNIKEKEIKKEDENKKEERKEEENIKEEEKKKEEEEKKKEEENIKEESKNKENNIYEKWNKYLNEFKDSVKKKRLTEDQEKDLILCIRFNYLSHSELVKLTNEAIMNEYKDLLLKALSMKLNYYEEEATNDDNNKIFNLNPRNALNQKNENNNTKFYNSQNYFNRELMNNNLIYKSNLNNISNYNFNNNDYKKEIYDNDGKLYRINKNNNYYTNVDSNYDNKAENDNFNENDDHLLNSQFFNLNNKREKEKINRYREMIKQDNKELSKSKFNNQLAYPLNYIVKFKYKNDFDKNGALYYIGTLGLSKNYNNPHKLKLLKAFGSPLLNGNYYDFVGRENVNLMTENEENSFLGVDLGLNRNLIPALYSIKNRDSSSNVLLSWNLQGSNDKIKFEILDSRNFVEKDKYRKYRNLLKEPGTTSTWGISKKIRERFPNGFRYFILKQIGKNSDNNYNLAISGFELYGEGIGNGWIFS